MDWPARSRANASGRSDRGAPRSGRLPVRPERNGRRRPEDPQRPGFRSEANLLREIRLMRPFLLVLGGVCVFGVAAALMIQIMPAPLKESDYLVIGCVATLVALLVMFLVLMAT